MGKVKLSDMELEGKSRGRPRRKVRRQDMELDEDEKAEKEISADVPEIVDVVRAWACLNW